MSLVEIIRSVQLQICLCKVLADLTHFLSILFGILSPLCLHALYFLTEGILSDCTLLLSVLSLLGIAMAYILLG